MNIFEKFGLRQVINGNGKMTVLGATATNSIIARTVSDALQNYVVIDELIEYTGKLIAEKTGAEDGCPTCGAASGTAISVAAVIAGNDLNKIEKLPDSDGFKNEIIIQKGHIVNFGGNIGQMIRLGGGILIEVGCANKVETDNIECAITDKTAALYCVKSHHAVQKGMQSIETMIEISKKHNIPLIIDAAAEEDLKKYISMGASMVLYSGGKALGGPTSGFICGNSEYIKACKKQYKGIGRAMKVSKEAMAGLIQALLLYDRENKNVTEQKTRMNYLCQELNKIAGFSCSLQQDEAGREIYRAAIQINAEAAKITAEELNNKLKLGNPAVFLREYYVDAGILSVDPRPLLNGQEEIILNKIKQYAEEAKG